MDIGHLNSFWNFDIRPVKTGTSLTSMREGGKVFYRQIYDKIFDWLKRLICQLIIKILAYAWTLCMSVIKVNIETA